MTDDDTPIRRLRGAVQDFIQEREWSQYHTPKNLAMSLAIEAAELMEHFQWLTQEESRAVTGSPDALAQVADELADVLCYAFSLANALEIDLTGAVLAKIDKNAAKYPAERFRGKYRVE